MLKKMNPIQRLQHEDLEVYIDPSINQKEIECIQKIKIGLDQGTDDNTFLLIVVFNFIYSSHN